MAGIALTCYFRHLQDLFAEAGIVVTKENKAMIDKAIHKIVGVNYKNCPLAWRKVKEVLGKGGEARKTFISELKKIVSSKWQVMVDVSNHRFFFARKELTYVFNLYSKI